jgi:hypothetical protein
MGTGATDTHETGTGSTDDDPYAVVMESMTFSDDAGQTVSVVRWGELDVERCARYAQITPEITNGVALSVELEKGGEAIVVVAEGKAEQLEVEDCITMEDLPLGSLLEYRFQEGEQTWLVSKIGLTAHSHYVGTKLESWKAMLLSVWQDCLASFIRMLQAGPMLQLFDSEVFPEVEAERAEWRIIDDNGRERKIPHPVHEMRRFDPATRAYVMVDSRLTGAPSEDEAEAFWSQVLEELKAATLDKVGADFIDDCLRMDVGELKAKYI